MLPSQSPHTAFHPTLCCGVSMVLPYRPSSSRRSSAPYILSNHCRHKKQLNFQMCQRFPSLILLPTEMEQFPHHLGLPSLDFVKKTSAPRTISTPVAEDAWALPMGLLWERNHLQGAADVESLSVATFATTNVFKSFNAFVMYLCLESDRPDGQTVHHEPSRARVTSDSSQCRRRSKDKRERGELRNTQERHGARMG